MVSNTFEGWILSKIKDARKNNNCELAILLKSIYDKHREFDRHSGSEKT
jgi:hypothetical protein